MRRWEMEMALFEAAIEGDGEQMRSLAEATKRHGDDGESLLDSENPAMQTVLHIAAKEGYDEIVRWLLYSKKGGGRDLGFSEVVAYDCYGRTAMHYAALKGNLFCCRSLAEGCDVENNEREAMMNAVTNDGKTALHEAVSNQQEDIICWLLSNEKRGGRTLGFTSESITALNNDSESALLEAVVSGSAACVKALLEGCTAGERLKLFLSADKQHGWTPLHWAVRCRKTMIIQELLRWEEVKTIVDNRDNRGMTALHRLACDGGLDKESHEEWETCSFDPPPPIGDVVKILLGLTSRKSKTTALTFVDVNAGLKIPVEIEVAEAVAAAEAEAGGKKKKKARRKQKEDASKRSRVL